MQELELVLCVVRSLCPARRLHASGCWESMVACRWCLHIWVNSIVPVSSDVVVKFLGGPRGRAGAGREEDCEEYQVTLWGYILGV